MDARRTSVREKKKPDFFGLNSEPSLPEKSSNSEHLNKILEKKTEYEKSFVMGGIDRSPQAKVAPPPRSNVPDVVDPPYSELQTDSSNINGVINPEHGNSSKQVPVSSSLQMPTVTLAGPNGNNNVSGIPMETENTSAIQPVQTQNGGMTETEEERNVRMRADRARKLQELKANRQRFIIHGTDDGLSNESESDNLEGNDTPMDSAVIAGKMLNLMDLQQKHQYANAYHINRIEANQNQYILRISGHDIQDTSDPVILRSWWEWLMAELGAPSKLRKTDTNLINFSTTTIENRGRPQQGYNNNKVLVLEFPTKETPKWVLNQGIMNCRKVQRLPGLGKLSFSPMLTSSEIKVQQYAQSVMNKLKLNFNGPAGARKSYLANIASLRSIGRLKQHIATIDKEGHKRNVHYNKLLTDELTRDFVPMEGGERALPPPDYTYQPQDHSLLEVDFKAEAKGMGVSLQGRSEGVHLRVPNYIQPSLRKMLNEEDKDGRPAPATGVNTERLGPKRFKQDWYNNPAAASGSRSNDNGEGYNRGSYNYDTSRNYNSESMRIGWNSSHGNRDMEKHRNAMNSRSHSKGTDRGKERNHRRSRSKSKKHSSKDKDVDRKSNNKPTKPSSRDREEMVETRPSRRGSVNSSYRRNSAERHKGMDLRESDGKDSVSKKREEKKKKKKRKPSPKRKHRKSRRGKHHSSSSNDSSSDSSSDSDTD